ncbi:MAG: hypothetical protein AAGF59_04925, partial [Pseudomonadota bacterium]
MTYQSRIVSEAGQTRGSGETIAGSQAMSEQQRHSDTKSPAPLWRRFAPLLAIAGLMAFGFAMGWHEYLSISEFIRQREALQTFVAANLLTAVGLFVSIYVVVTALSLPGAAILTIAGGFLFGLVLGAASAVIGATLGATA